MSAGERPFLGQKSFLSEALLSKGRRGERTQPSNMPLACKGNEKTPGKGNAQTTLGCRYCQSYYDLGSTRAEGVGGHTHRDQRKKKEKWLEVEKTGRGKQAGDRRAG